MNDQLVGTVVYNRENLNIGWIAVGISDYEVSIMYISLSLLYIITGLGNGKC